ncbi:oligosaccharide flippase family protein [Bacillus thuringiensis]|uniref:lipopolysaccharide biosynthesis protein n=1 Tax=Bacillus thuringiensis TaxID=1428 RepID=UPI000BF4AA0A|nr:oligosaccharide flippase family protein [Bacillus thuringiensis]PEY65875.1 hypothetical protein CN352_11775 [Bacillus thuringiensis]
MKFKRFIKTALVFFTGNVLIKLVSFFLLPLYTNKISPDQFGSYDFVMSIINLIAPIAFFQIWDGMYRYAFDYEKEQDKQNVITNSIVVCLFGCIIYFALFSLVQHFFEFQYFEYIIIYGLLYALNYLYTYTARVFLANKLFVFSGVMGALTTSVLNVVFIVGLGWDIKSIYVSSIIGLIIQILIIELKVGVLCHFKISKTDYVLIVQMIKFSLPLCVATISYWLLSGYTKFLIMNFNGDSANGIYAIANKFSAMLTLVVSVLQFAWNETAYLMTNDSERKKNYPIFIDIMTTGVAYGVAVFCLITKVIFPYVINVQYHDAIYLVPATVIGVGANSLAGLLGTLFLTEKKTNYILISTLLSSLVNIILGYFAAKYYGVYGASVVLALSFVILMVLRLAKLKRMYDIKLKALKLASILSVIVISTLAFFLLASNVAIIVVILIIILMFVFSVREYFKHLMLSNKRG